jgi:hypothetical protein
MLNNGGGYGIGLDHRVLPETSLEAFKHYVDRVKRMLAQENQSPTSR